MKLKKWGVKSPQKNKNQTQRPSLANCTVKLKALLKKAWSKKIPWCENCRVSWMRRGDKLTQSFWHEKRKEQLSFKWKLIGPKMLACFHCWQKQKNMPILRALHKIRERGFAIWIQKFQQLKAKMLKSNPIVVLQENHLQHHLHRLILTVALEKQTVMIGSQRKLIELHTISEPNVPPKFQNLSWTLSSMIWTKFGGHARKSRFRGFVPNLIVRCNFCAAKSALRNHMIRLCKSRT